MKTTKKRIEDKTIRLNTHLKRMIVKASTMGFSVATIHERIDEILKKYGVKDKLPTQESKKKHG